MDGVSFVTTIYNKADHIAANAAALFGQKGDFPRQYIFVDDGSSDDSVDRLRQISAGRDDVLILTKPNGGPAAAFNYGSRQARFGILKPMDGDDILDANATLNLLQAMKTSNAPLVMGHKVVLPANPQPAPLADGPLQVWSPHDALTMAINQSLSGCSEVLVRKDAFDQVGGCDERLFIQDQSYLRRIIAKGGTLAMLDQIVAYSPPSPQDALCFNKPQIEHDNSAAWVNMVADGLIASPAHQRQILKKCASRAWRYAHRIQKKPLGTHCSFWVYMASYAPLPGTKALLATTLAPYLSSGSVRRGPAAN